MSVSFNATQSELIVLAHELENQISWVEEEGVLHKHVEFRDLSDDLCLDPRVRSFANALVRSYHRFMREHKAMIGGDRGARMTSVRLYHRLVVAACQDLQQVLER